MISRKMRRHDEKRYAPSIVMVMEAMMMKM